MIQGNYDFPDIVAGDTSETTEFVITVNAAPLILTGATIKMDFRDPSGKVVKYFTTENSTITIVDAINGRFRIEKYTCDIPAKTYDHDIEITLPSGVKKTYVKGQINVLDEVTL